MSAPCSEATRPNTTKTHADATVVPRFAAPTFFRTQGLPPRRSTECPSSNMSQRQGSRPDDRNVKARAPTTACPIEQHQVVAPRRSQCQGSCPNSPQRPNSNGMGSADSLGGSIHLRTLLALPTLWQTYLLLIKAPTNWQMPEHPNAKCQFVLVCSWKSQDNLSPKMLDFPFEVVRRESAFLQSLLNSGQVIMTSHEQHEGKDSHARCKYKNGFTRSVRHCTNRTNLLCWNPFLFF